ncbi:thioredoxin domain-containing protein [Microbulbifer yueqingensis]|uniref:thioredoxin domain-containing protein n=1 Tax=Microbulbifer yueqingensis TaxID=658219 RepID=UPI001FE1B76C|nr:thioredoxin domain-containing protein [Microbulbifer yueqingensis]
MLLAGCSADRGHGSAERAQASAETVVARIGDRPITMAEVDHGIRLERHDLAEAEFRLRSGQLRKLIDSNNASGAADGVEWLLEPPAPPRMEIPVQGRDLRGNPEAPVTLAIFCSYQSPHCAQLNPILLRLLENYAGWLRLAPFDLPLRYHRQGPAATAAAFCARLQGAGWRYADGLYALGDRLVEDGFVRLAAMQDLDREAFKACLRDHASAPGLPADRALASELGLRSVPVVFINGLYTKGPRPYEYYALWIDREMERLGLDPARTHPEAARFAPGGALPPETTLPLVLSGTSVSTKAQESIALISAKGAGAGSFYSGDMLLDGVRLGAIRKSHVLLDNRGRLERLSLRGQEAEGVRVPLTSPAPRDEETMRRIEQPQGEQRKLVEPTAVLPLGREWLEEQLRNREELEKRFVAAEHQVDGHNLLKLEGIEDSEFFAALGLEEGDVVVRVNDTWVHSEQNQLWDALTSGQVVDVTFMRNGLPQRYQYVVEEKGYFESPEDGSGDNRREDDDGSGDE